MVVAGQRSWSFMMNPVRKRLRLSLSPSSIEILRPQPPSAVLLSHDALLLPPSPAPAKGGAEEAEDEGYLLVEEDTTDSSLIITMDDSRLDMEAARTKVVRKRKLSQGEEEHRGGTSENEEEEARVEIDRQLDQSLETKSKQHNLTTVNVRNILHEVITNEHVVAMMKAAINETEAVPPFEPKMTRSKFKEVVEKGVVIPAWNISPIKKTSDVNKAPQFVDIPLAEDDSSDEEYHPDEEEEDETAEDTFQESDMESTASSPRGSRLREDSCSPWQMFRSQTRTLRKRSVSMGPPPPPKGPSSKAVTDSTFLEKLHAVEEELAVCMEPYQVRLENTRVTWNNPSKHQEPLSESEEEVAYRTRSKRPLRDVPLGRLEAELQAPDITPDMYDPGSAHEDREWTDWLRGLMSSDMDNEEECDDEDDPEYNFLADIDEPDLEDYRDDKAVRITKKEVNELMEELFETLKEDLAGQEVDDEGPEEEEEPQEEANSVQTHTPEEQHHILCYNEVDDRPITELRTVKQQLKWIRSQPTHTLGRTRLLCAEPHTLKLDAQQKVRLQQQLQQHIQLLTQIHLLSSPVSRLHSEAETTRQFLFELDVLAQRSELLLSSVRPGFCSIYRVSNLQGALQLLEELRQTPISYTPQHPSPDARGHMRCFPTMPAELAWLFATRRVFLYPELLPCVSLDPALYCPRRTAAFTAAEDCLLALGLRNMEGTCDPTKLASQFLLRKTVVQVRRRILQCCRPGFPDNIVKVFRYQRRLWPMPVACSAVSLSEQRPPVEREESVLPLWLVRSLPVIYQTIKQYNSPPGSTPEALPPCRGSRPRQSQLTFLRSATNMYTFSPRTTYPPRLPNNLDFRRIGFILLQQPLSPFPRADPAPLSDRRIDLSFPPPTYKPCPSRPLSHPQFLLHRLVLTRIEPLTDIISTSQVSMTITERIRHHYQTLTSLRRRRKSSSLHLTPPLKGPAPCQLDNDDVIRMNKEEEGNKGIFSLSELPASIVDAVGSEPEGRGSENEAEVTAFRTAADEEGDDDDDDEGAFSDESRVQAQSAENDDYGDDHDDEEDGQRFVEDEAFAQDYLQRVCEVVQLSTGMSEQLLQVLDQFSVVKSSETVEHLYVKLSRVLWRWPQLLRDFAAFLNRGQAQRCGLLLEQQLFECSRRFLWQLRQRLGENSSLYQQVVSVLQGSPTPSPEDMDEICSLLQCHPDLQEALQQLYAHPSPLATSSDTTEAESASNSLPQIFRGETGGAVVCARNVSMTSSGEKVVIWTREADRTILTFCQQRGASRKTFRQISAHLGNKTAQQVSLRFQQLMNLFQKSTSRSPESISRQEAVPD